MSPCHQLALKLAHAGVRATAVPVLRPYGSRWRRRPLQYPTADNGPHVAQQMSPGAHHTGIVVQWERTLMQPEQRDVGQRTDA
jgi:hypothetical protein